MALRIGDLTATTSFLGTAEYELSLTGSAGSRKVTASNLRKQLLAGGTGFTSTDPLTAGIATLAGGTVTTSQPVVSVTQTWNDAAVTFTGLLANFTSTASAAASLLLDLQVASASKFSVRKDGLITGAAGITISSGTASFQAVTATTIAMAGALSGVTTMATSSTINGQTISSAANFTGTLATAGNYTSTVGSGYNITLSKATGAAINWDQSGTVRASIGGLNGADGLVFYSTAGSTEIFRYTGTTFVLNSIPLSGVTTLAVTGGVGIGGASDSSVGLWVQPTIVLATSTQTGIQSNVDFTSAATVSGFAGYFQARTAAAAFTLTNAYGLYIANANKGAGSAITNLYGLYIAAPSGGATLNYGIYVAGGPNVLTGALSGITTLDTTSYAGINAVASSSTGLVVNAGSAAQSSLRIPHGSAPTSPVDGDVWSTTTTLNFRLNGVTKTVTLT